MGPLARDPTTQQLFQLSAELKTHNRWVVWPPSHHAHHTTVPDVLCAVSVLTNQAQKNVVQDAHGTGHHHGPKLHGN